MVTNFVLKQNARMIAKKNTSKKIILASFEVTN